MAISHKPAVRYSRQALFDRLASLEKEKEAGRVSRRAALNLMEDAVLAKRQADEINEQLKLEMAERERHKKALAESEERLRTLVEGVGDYAIITQNGTGTITGWNNAAETIFGFTKEEAIGENAELIFTPDDRESGASAKEIETATRDGRAEDERFHIRKNGSKLYVSGVLSRIDFGGSIGFVKIARDMTERIAAERDQREKEMLQTLVRAQEEERGRLARDLHDELGQQLTALRLKLDAVSLDRPETITETIADIRAMARNIDDGVDRLAWDLRPAVLDDLGLASALTRFVNEWSKQSGVKASIVDAERSRVRLSPEVEINLYRIAQECLNNVHKHAKAEKVEVMLRSREDSLLMIVADDGRGFDSEDRMLYSKGLGLVGMRERASLVSGELDIESSPGGGTTVYVRVPISPATQADYAS